MVQIPPATNSWHLAQLFSIPVLSKPSPAPCSPQLVERRREKPAAARGHAAASGHLSPSLPSPSNSHILVDGSGSCCREGRDRQRLLRHRAAPAVPAALQSPERCRAAAAAAFHGQRSCEIRWRLSPALPPEALKGFAQSAASSRGSAVSRCFTPRGILQGAERKLSLQHPQGCLSPQRSPFPLQRAKTNLLFLKRL